MAYFALGAILASLVFLLSASVYDGILATPEECSGILDSLGKVQGLFVWIEGFLATIVGAYYGVSSFRPSS